MKPKVKKTPPPPAEQIPGAGDIKAQALQACDQVKALLDNAVLFSDGKGGQIGLGLPARVTIEQHFQAIRAAIEGR